MIEKIVTGGFSTNTYIISNSGKCVVVDPGLDFEKYAEQIKAKYSVEAILLTHGHLDHIDGIRFFNVPIYISILEEPFLYDSTLSLYNFFGSKTPFKKEELDVRLLSDGDTFLLIGYQFKVIHTPGHTKGSCCYLYNNKLLSGDTLFHLSCGRTDFPTGSSSDMKKSLNKLISMLDDNVEVYPGHEQKTSIKLERKNNPYL